MTYYVFVLLFKTNQTQEDANAVLDALHENDINYEACSGSWLDGGYKFVFEVTDVYAECDACRDIREKLTPEILNGFQITTMDATEESEYYGE